MTNPMTPTPSTGDGLIERVRKELFSNLAHYRQGCISERDDAKKVVEFAHALAADTIQTLQTERNALLADKARLDALQSESWDLRCFAIPTGAGDADIGWQVIGHFMAEPQERMMGEVWHDDLRDAIDAALNSNPNTSGEAK